MCKPPRSHSPIPDPPLATAAPSSPALRPTVADALQTGVGAVSYAVCETKSHCVVEHRRLAPRVPCSPVEPFSTPNSCQCRHRPADPRIRGQQGAADLPPFREICCRSRQPVAATGRCLLSHPPRTCAGDARAALLVSPFASSLPVSARRLRDGRNVHAPGHRCTRRLDEF